MLNCKQCGKPLNDDFVLCPYCGAAVPAEEDPTPPARGDFVVPSGAKALATGIAGLACGILGVLFAFVVFVAVSTHLSAGMGEEDAKYFFSSILKFPMILAAVICLASLALSILSFHFAEKYRRFRIPDKKVHAGRKMAKAGIALSAAGILLDLAGLILSVVYFL